MALTTVFSQAAMTIPGGAFVSPTFVMPSNIATVSVVFTVSAPDITDPTKSMTYIMERQDPNNAANWLFDNGFTWVGNSISAKTGLPVSPSSVTEVGPLAGQTCRARLVLPSSLTTGVLITTA